MRGADIGAGCGGRAAALACSKAAVEAETPSPPTLLSSLLQLTDRHRPQLKRCRSNENIDARLCGCCSSHVHPRASCGGSRKRIDEREAAAVASIEPGAVVPSLSTMSIMLPCVRLELLLSMHGLL